MRKYLLLISVICIQFIQAQMIPPAILAKNPEFDFGTIEEGQIVTYDYMIVNNGGDELVITSVRPSCGCTAAQPEKNILLPGETTRIRIDFTSEGRVGEQHKQVSVFSNDPKMPELVLKFKGKVLPKGQTANDKAKIFLPETEHDFGVVKEGELVEYTFKVLNTGTADLEIKEVNTSCGCTAALMSSRVIKPNSDATIKVEFDTKDRVGKTSRNITIVTNDPVDKNKIITIYADIVK